jgi:putative DNA methylase
MPQVPLEQTPPAATSAAGAALHPFALKDAPALIEAVFPAQKISFEAQRERKAGAGQTLTALGSYWKGRKPLILVRAILLGSLLPQTDDPEKDLEVFEKLMAFDNDALARRALENNAFKPNQIAKTLELQDPWKYFTYTIKAMSLSPGEVSYWIFPLDPDKEGIAIRWRKTTTEDMKLGLYGKMLETLGTYEERAGLCKRPEEMDQTALYASIWPTVNAHLSHLGIAANSHQELVEQLGMLRYGHRPRVGDTFCGGGSIPFEAARLGCDVYASDLNPIACMLTWGALNIVGALAGRNALRNRADQREVSRGRGSGNHGAPHRARQSREPGQGVPLLPGTRCQRDRLDGADGAELGDFQDARRRRQARAASSGPSTLHIHVVTDVSVAENGGGRTGTVREGQSGLRTRRQSPPHPSQDIARRPS